MAGNRDVYEKHMTAGHDAAWDQNWPVAIRAYTMAVQEFEEDPEAQLHLGLSFLSGAGSVASCTCRLCLAEDSPLSGFVGISGEPRQGVRADSCQAVSPLSRFTMLLNASRTDCAV